MGYNWDDENGEIIEAEVEEVQEDVVEAEFKEVTKEDAQEVAAGIVEVKDYGTFFEIAAKMGYKQPSIACKSLGIQQISDWTLTLNEALDKLAQQMSIEDWTEYIPESVG